MGGTIQDWRADLVDDGYGNLDLSPSARATLRALRCDFTRAGIVEAVRSSIHVDGVRVMAGPGRAVVALRMDHEYSPGGTCRADRLRLAAQVLEHIRPAGIELAVILDDDTDPLRTCRRCRAVITDDTGDAPNAGACAGCADRDQSRHRVDQVKLYLQDQLAEVIRKALERHPPPRRASMTDLEAFARSLAEPPPRTMLVLECVVGTNEEDPTDGKT